MSPPADWLRTNKRQAIDIETSGNNMEWDLSEDHAAVRSESPTLQDERHHGAQGHKELEEEVLENMRWQKTDPLMMLVSPDAAEAPGGSNDGDRRQVAEKWDDKMEQLSWMFEAALTNEEKRREVLECTV
ncbi:u-box domain protein [Apiospora saccharicola]|uniref:U-box domain protein n=1 Tax=Apiospora saccharicola TaxID=335842 RepID=A0ABR1U5G5_9PEZI